MSQSMYSMQCKRVYQSLLVIFSVEIHLDKASCETSFRLILF